MIKKIYIILCFIVCFSLPAGAITIANYTPYVSCVTSTSIVVTWQTDLPATASSVDYGLTTGYGSSVSALDAVWPYPSYYDAFKPVESVHYGWLEGLTPDTTYHYRVISDSYISSDYTFKTFPVPGYTRVKICIAGDNRGATTGGDWDKITTCIANENPDVVLHTGDLTSSPNSETEMNGQYFKFVSKFNFSRWVAPTIGNHEFQGHPAAFFYKQFFVAPSTSGLKGKDAGEYYSFDVGNTHVICMALGGGETYPAGADYSGGTVQYAINYGGPHHDSGQNSPQYQWLKDDLIAAKARGVRWIIAYGHYPYTNIESWHSSLWGMGMIADLWEAYGVDYYFCGHAHVYERFVPIRHLQQHPDSVTPAWTATAYIGNTSNIPARRYDPDGVRYIVTGGGGAEPGPLTWSSAMASLIACSTAAASSDYKSENRGHYIVLEIDDTKCTFFAKRTDGTVFDMETIIKTVLTKNISGTITSGGANLSGVTVTLSGGAVDSATTGTNGAYSFTVSTGLSYVVTPSKTYYTFTPLSQSFSSVADNQTQNFTAAYTGPTYSITGIVCDTASVAMNGVVVTLSGSVNTTANTNPSGAYSFTGLVAGGGFTIVPSRVNYTFSPLSMNYSNLSSSQTQNFTGTRNPGSPTYDLSGYVTYSSGTAISGITVVLSTATTVASAVTDANGYYEFVGYSSGTYTVTPQDSGRYYTPSDRTYPLLNTNTTGQNFIGLAIIGATTYRISGYARDINDLPVNAVTMSLTGKTITSAQTNSEGYYQFVGLSTGAYTVTPSKTGYSFNSVLRKYAYLSSNETSQDFIVLNSSQAGGFIKELTVPSSPLDVAVDQSNSDYYVTTVNNVLYSYDTTGTSKEIWISGGYPAGIVTDSNYIFAGENSYVTRYVKDNVSQILTWGGSFTGSGTQQLAGAGGIAVDKDNVYVSDTNNSRIHKLNISGGYSSIIGAGELSNPKGLTICDDCIYVCDYNSNTIKKFTKDGAQLGGEITTLDKPLDIVIDSNDTIYILLKNDYVYVYNTNGSYLGKWGGSLGTSQGQFDGASGLGIDKSNNIYVADKNNNRIQVFRGYVVIQTTQTYSISGYVRNDIGAGMADVSVSLTGTTNDTAITNASGLYTFSSLISAGNYTVKPIKSRYSFSPSSKTYTSLGGNYTAQNFVGTEVTGLALSGYVKDKDGQYLSGVQLALVGSNNTDTAQNTGTDGYYSFSGLTAGNYTLTPFKHNYIFSPGNIVYRELSADKDELIVGATSDTVKQLNANIYLKLVNNVFNPKEDKKVVIAYNVKTEGKVKVNVYDLRGTLITKIVDDEMNAGTYLGEWDGKDKDGKVLPTGIYLVNIDAPGIRQTKKLCIIK